MIYKNFKGEKLSSLGMGCMRFPLIEGTDEIDIKKTKEMFKICFEKGINYFDTAYGYHSGKSEIVVGELLKEYPRESFYLASKFPGYSKENFERVEEIFEEQLRKCQVDYFDFYLFHNVTEGNIDQYTDEEIGVHKYLMKQKELGRIKHLGFSAHGQIPTIKRFLDTYGKDLEFCQLQINYIDWTLQHAKEKVELLDSYNIDVWVMEPVRGGRLQAIDPLSTKILENLRPDHNVVAWAFRFLQSIPSVKMILSGMSNMEQLLDNIHTFEENKPLNEIEMKALLDVAYKMTNEVMCTSCRYCTDYCPQSLNIPNILKMYNEQAFLGRLTNQLKQLPVEEGPKSCIGCQACEAVCPQNIEISLKMKELSEKLNNI